MDGVQKGALDKTLFECLCLLLYHQLKHEDDHFLSFFKSHFLAFFSKLAVAHLKRAEAGGQKDGVV